jgi:hypothetical protein
MPAFIRYNGPWYKDFRKHIRQSAWPPALDVAILSAEHGLIGALSPIHDYDRRMTRERAAELAPSLQPIIEGWAGRYERVNLCLGADYLPALPERFVAEEARVFEGPIGLKRQQLGSYLRSLAPAPQSRVMPRRDRLMYFLPDWDDLLDADFDFKADAFSGPRANRNDVHCSRLMQPDRIADGILVSLAQARTSKGPLRYVGGIDARTLRPLNLRDHYGLAEDQLLFGDCGAFSYVNEDKPPISTAGAVSLYNLYGFDLAASIDHIPVPTRNLNGRVVDLTDAERRERVRLTVRNAAEFISEAKRTNATFTPVGTVQGLTPEDYAVNARLYSEMGYERIALGGLVPLPDEAISRIVKAVRHELDRCETPPDIHLFGVFRPKLQETFRNARVSSFDSATYFRKAWLRSGQNYLSRSGKWYAAIRVPMTSDGRTLTQLLRSGSDLEELKRLEAGALHALHLYDQAQLSLEETLDAIEAYDRTLTRSSEDASAMRRQYARTLSDRPWNDCHCQVCTSIGIDVVVFRGSNRNKRRGAHNTAMLYRAVEQGAVGV